MKGSLSIVNKRGRQSVPARLMEMEKKLTELEYMCNSTIFHTLLVPPLLQNV